MQSLVVDANVIAYAGEGNTSSDTFQACLFITSLITYGERLKLAIDNNNEIIEEYERRLNSIRTPHADMFKQFLQKQIYQDRPSEDLEICVPIHESEVEELKADGFDEDDLIYARIGPRTDLQLIISNDGRSLLDEEYQTWLQNNLSVETCWPTEVTDKIPSL